MAFFDHAVVRRAVTVPGVFAAFVVLTMLLPLLLVVALLSDPLRRRRRVVLRALLMVELYLACEVVGVVASAGVRLLPGSAEVSRRRYLGLQRWWGRTLLRGAVALFSLRLDFAELAEQPRASIFLVRHTSHLDTLLPVELISDRMGLDLRYVLKRGLLWSPSLDIVGHRLPNAFVRRDGADTPGELARLRELGEGLREDEGLVLFPEGTRFTPAKWERALASIGRSDLGRAQRLSERREVLPARRGGVLALLEAAPEADLVVLAHTGLEGIAGFLDMLKPDLVGRRVEVEMWRIPRVEVPKDVDGQREWLDREWSRLDEWVARHRSVEAIDG